MRRGRYVYLGILGLAMCIIPPLVATAMQFPIWIEHSAEATVSGAVVFCAILCFVPLYKKILAMLKSPSAPLMWTIFAVLMYVMKSIADEMFIVSVVGAISNVIGWGLFKLRRYLIRGALDERIG